MKVVGWTVAVLLGLIAVIFAANNFHDMRLELWPLPYTIQLPVFLFTLLLLLIGFLGGLVAAWFAAARRRRRAREQKRELKSLRTKASERPALAAPAPDSEREAQG